MAQETPQHTTISHVEIVILRHSQAVSNVARPGRRIPGPSLTLEDVHKLVDYLTRQDGTSIEVGHGGYLPDGLTQHGLVDAEMFPDSVERGSIGKLDNVYMLVSSDLTRAIQTVRTTAGAFRLVGPLHTPGGGTGEASGETAKIYCHPGLREATSWPQDLPPLLISNQSGTFASYFKLQGGDGPDAGRILGEERVNFTNVIWPDGMSNEPTTLEARLAAVTTPPSLDAIERRFKEARLWLRDWVMEVLQIHKSKGGHGTPRIVFITHGGGVSFVTEDWHCDFKMDGNSNTPVWVGSAALRNLDVVVYRFSPLQDDEAKLEEVSWDPYYEGVFGQHYRHMASDKRLVYTNPDGTRVDQKAAHWEFIKSVATEVREVAGEQKALFEALLAWEGLRVFATGAS